MGMSPTADAAPEPLRDLVIRDVAVLDCTGREPSGRHDVEVRDGKIAAIRPAGGAAPARGEALEVDGAGTTLMPGLTDAHVHFALIGKQGRPRRRAADRPRPEGRRLHRRRARRRLHDRPRRGRPRAGVGEGGREGPRFGGRGSCPRDRCSARPADMATAGCRTGGYEDAAIPGLIARTVIVDGADEVRRAVREQLRRGATQIKLLASGGIASPTDPFDSVQFSAGEIAAATEVAAGWHTYVLAHCHTSPAIDVAIANGVRSIEHGSLLEEATAKRMKELGRVHGPDAPDDREARRASGLVEPPAGEGRPAQGGPGARRRRASSWPTRSASRSARAPTSSGRGRAGGARRS